jgi:hypothetical protein
VRAGLTSRELKGERERLTSSLELLGEPPQIGAATTMVHRDDLPKLAGRATPAERREFARA